MIHFNKKTGILSLRLPTHDIPFHYGTDVADGFKDMADAEEHVNKILAVLDDQKTPSDPSLRDAKKGIDERLDRKNGATP